MLINKKLAFTLAALAGWGICKTSALSADEETIISVFEDARLLFDSRLRYEFADMEGFERNANALTFRSRFGFQTGDYHGFQGLVEGDFTRDLGVNNFNSTTNGLVQFPVIADPNSERLNRLQLSYNGITGTNLTVGRQRIKLDNDRFIGNVGFRQNEQTFDSVRLTNSAISNLTLDYSYLWQVNRIFGSNSVNDQADADTHLINGSYELPFGKIVGYAYLIDLDDLPLASNQTYGGRLIANHKIDEAWTLFLTAEYANQQDLANNPDEFNLDYFLIEPGVKWKQLTVKGAFESLEGNGQRGFATPLATLHKFQGFADVFLNTPASGIEDLQFNVDYRLQDVAGIGPVRLAAWYHDFNSETGSQGLGREFDFGVFVTPWKNVTFSVEYANFNSSARADLRRLFLTLEVKY